MERKNILCIIHCLLLYVHFNSRRSCFFFKEKCFNKGKWNERIYYVSFIVFCCTYISIQGEVVFFSKRNALTRGNGPKEYTMYHSLSFVVRTFQFKEKLFFFQREML